MIKCLSFLVFNRLTNFARICLCCFVSDLCHPSCKHQTFVIMEILDIFALQFTRQSKSEKAPADISPKSSSTTASSAPVPEPSPAETKPEIKNVPFYNFISVP